MSRRGCCHDYADVESFLQLLKRELIKKKICGMRKVACSDIFDYSGILYNRNRRYGLSDDAPPPK